MAKEFGGFSEYQALGDYTSETKGLIQETVYIIESYFVNDNDKLIESIASRLGSILEQECILVKKMEQYSLSNH